MQRRSAICLATALLLPGTAQACKCLPALSVSWFDRAQKVVTGRIAHVDRAPFEGMQTVELAVERTWKGRAEPNVTVELHTQSGACGFRVDEGMRVAWLLWPSGKAVGTPYHTDICLVPSVPEQSITRIEPLGRAYQQELDATTDVADRLQVQLRVRDYEGAADLVEELGKQPNLDTRLRFLRGKFFFETQNYARAVDELQTVSENAEAKRLSGWARIRIGDRGALADFELSGLQDFYREVDLTGLDLHGQMIENVKLSKLTLRDANFRGAVFRTSYMSGWFEGTDFRNADLRGLRLQPWGPLRNVDLRGAQLGDWDGVSFDGADLRGASADGKKLHNVRLGGAKLEGASFRDADLRELAAAGVDLRGVDLRGAKLRQARLHDADLSGARIERADFRFAGYNDNTRFPAGFDPEAMLMQKNSERVISDARRRTIEEFYGRTETPPFRDKGRNSRDPYYVDANLPVGFVLPSPPAELLSRLGLRPDMLGLYVVGTDLIAVDPENRRVLDRVESVVP